MLPVCDPGRNSYSVKEQLCDMLNTSSGDGGDPKFNHSSFESNHSAHSQSLYCGAGLPFTVDWTMDLKDKLGCL